MDLQAFLQQSPAHYADTQALGRCLRALVEAGFDQLPLPGNGQTLERFQRLAEVAGHDRSSTIVDSDPVHRSGNWNVVARTSPGAMGCER